MSEMTDCPPIKHNPVRPGTKTVQEQQFVRVILNRIDAELSLAPSFLVFPTFAAIEGCRCTRFDALIIGGSVAKGFARPDYDGGYVDGKIINQAYLEELADKGNEPSRAAFHGAFVAYSPSKPRRLHLVYD